MSLFYIFNDPKCPCCGHGDVMAKVGITSYPKTRIGVYQNSYSVRKQHHQFDCVYYGSLSNVTQLEKAVKDEFDWDIENDGRGQSEWVWDWTSDQIAKEVDEIIKGYAFHIKKLPKKFLPVNINNLDEVLAYIAVSNGS